MRQRVSLAAALVVSLALIGAASAAGPRVLREGDKRLYAASQVTKGHQFVCVVGGVRATGRVPARGRTTIVIADGFRDSATLRLRRKATGGLAATCE